jgi:hypothetical protein
MNYLEAAKEALLQYRKAVSTNDINDKSRDALQGGYDKNDKTTEPLESVLKGLAVELWSDRAGRLFITADAEDVQRLIADGVSSGEIYTAAEARCIIRISDPTTVAEIHDWKRRFEATLRQVNGHVGDDR